MRLIDADKFKEFLINLCEAGAPYDGVIELLDKEPTAYDVDKIVEELEDALKESRNYCKLDYQAGLNRAIEIVKGGGKNE